MRDPYLFDDVPILKNKLNIKNADDLQKFETDIAAFKLLDVDGAVKNENFDFNRLKAVHKHIFGDIYEWAGEPRIMNIEKAEAVLKGLSVSYCDYKKIEKEANAVIDDLKSVSWKSLDIDKRAETFAKKIAKLWQVHPFREGNSRTVMTFAAQFAESRDIPIDKELLKVHAAYVRKSLVLSSIGEYSEYKYLTKIIKDSMEIAQKLKKEIDVLEKASDKVKVQRVKDIFKSDIPNVNTISTSDARLLYDFHQRFPDIKTHEKMKELKKSFTVKALDIEASPILKTVSKAIEVIEKLMKKSKSLEKSNIGFDRDM